MLFYVGVRHAFLVTDLKGKERLFLVSGIGATALLTSNIAIAYGLEMGSGIFLVLFERSFVKKMQKS